MTTLSSNAATFGPREAGPALQWNVPSATLSLASSIAANGSVSSAVIPSNGWQKIAVGLTSTQAGQIQIQRYIDAAGTVPQGAALTVSLSAGVSSAVNATDGAPFGSFKITVTNTAASAATLSGVAVLMQSA